MKTHRPILVTVLYILLASCNSQSPVFSDSQKAEAEKQIREISMKWLELWNNKDAEGLKAFWADDGTAYRQKIEPAVGPEAIYAVYVNEFKQNPKMISDWKTDKVIVTSSGDYAVEYGIFADKGLGLDGTQEDYGKYVTVYKNVNGTWKVYSDMGISTKPAETAK